MTSSRSISLTEKPNWRPLIKTMNTAIHLTEFYQEILCPSEYDCVSIDFRTDDIELGIELAETRDGRFFTVSFDEAATELACGNRLQTLASRPNFMLADDGPDYVVLQTVESEPDNLISQTKEIADALDADRFAVFNVQLGELERGNLLEQVTARLVRAGLLDRRSVSYKRV